MGLLSRPAAETETVSKVSESRWLFPLKRLEEDLLENVLISRSCSTSWASGRRGKNIVGGKLKEQPMRNLVQRKFEKFGKNVAVKVHSLKHVFLEGHEKALEPAGTARNECRKVARNELIRATLLDNPGSQLPDVLVNNLQSHFDSLPSSYARAGFNFNQVFMHYRLLEQVKLQHSNEPVVHVQAVDTMSRASDVSEPSSTSSPSSAWEETLRGISDELIHVAFACNCVVSKPALVWVFEHEMVAVRQATVFEKKGISLGVLTIQSAGEKTHQEFICRVIKSAIRKSRFSKFSLGLCGCEVPSLSTDQRNVRSTGSGTRREPMSMSADDHSHDFKDIFWNEADFNFTSTSFVNNTGFEFSTPYPCYGVGPPISGGVFRILVTEGSSPAMISGEEEFGRWIIDGADLAIEEEIASGSAGAVVQKGRYKGEAVVVKEIKGTEGASILEGEFRRDALMLASEKHKNVVSFYGVSVDSRHSSYIATISKYISGGSLRSLIQKVSFLKLGEVLRIARDVAEGLRFLHDHGVVHRDLRSSRIMLDERGTALVDFLEVARLYNGLSEEPADRANFQWMAPEVLGAASEIRTPSGKCDVYSYGMLLWEMVTGQLPFENLSPVQATVGIAVHGMRPHVPDGTFLPLKCLIEQCWASDPVDRPDFTEILEALDKGTRELLGNGSVPM